MTRPKRLPPPPERVASALEFLKEIDIGSILDESIQPRQPPGTTQPQRKLRINEPDTRILHLHEYPTDLIVSLNRIVHYAQHKNKTPDEVKAKLLEVTEERKKKCDRTNRIKEVVPKDVNVVMEAWYQAARCKRAAEELSTTDGPLPSKHKRPGTLERMMNRLVVGHKSQSPGWGRNTDNKDEKDDRGDGRAEPDSEHDKHGDHQALSAAVTEDQVTTDGPFDPMDVD